MKKSMYKHKKKIGVAMIIMFLFIPIIYSANDYIDEYALEINNDIDIIKGEDFNIKIKQTNDIDSEKNRIVLKLDKNIDLDSMKLIERNIKYNYNEEEKILELESKNFKSNVDIPLIAAGVGKSDIELYENDKKIDEENIFIEDEDMTALYPDSLVSSFAGISPTSYKSITVNTGAEFHAAMLDKTITEINIGSNFALSQFTGVAEYTYMDAYKRPSGTDIIINGNGNTVDFRGMSYAFNNTTDTNYNSITFNNINIQGRNWFGPVTILNRNTYDAEFLYTTNTKTLSTITYNNVNYEGSQMTSAWISTVIIKGRVESKSVNSYISKIDLKSYNTGGGMAGDQDQQNLDVSNITFSKDSEYIGTSNTMPIVLGYKTTEGIATLEENAKVTLQRYGSAGETHVTVRPTLYMKGNLTLGKNSVLNTISGIDRQSSTAGGIRIAGKGSGLTVGEGAKLNVTTFGAVTADNAYAGISIDNDASLNVNSNGQVNIVQRNKGDFTTSKSVYMGSNSKLNIGEKGLFNINSDGIGSGIDMGVSSSITLDLGSNLNINLPNTSSVARNGINIGASSNVILGEVSLIQIKAGGGASGITTGGSSNLSIGKRAKLDIKLGNISTSTRNGILTGTSSKLIVEEDGLLGIEIDGAGGGIKVGTTSLFNVGARGNLNINLKNTKTSTSSALSAAANTLLEVKKDGIMDIKSDGTASKKLINIDRGADSNFKFFDAKRINLEFTEIPNTTSKLIYMPDGYLSGDVQSVKVWNKNSLLVNEMTPDKSWTPIWTPPGWETVRYNSTGDTRYVNILSMNQTVADDFSINFKTENYRKLLFEGIPDVQVTIDKLSSGSRIITGKTNPGAYVRFSMIEDFVIPQGTIKSPLDSEKTDSTKNYHVIADSLGNYSYNLPSGSYFREGTAVYVYSYLNGKYAENKTLVENAIHVPDPNLRKSINSELVRIGLPSRDISLEYYSLVEMESHKA